MLWLRKNIVIHVMLAVSLLFITFFVGSSVFILMQREKSLNHQMNLKTDQIVVAYNEKLLGMEDHFDLLFQSILKQQNLANYLVKKNTETLIPQINPHLRLLAPELLTYLEVLLLDKYGAPLLYFQDGMSENIPAYITDTQLFFHDERYYLQDNTLNYFFIHAVKDPNTFANIGYFVAIIPIGYIIEELHDDFRKQHNYLDFETVVLHNHPNLGIDSEQQEWDILYQETQVNLDLNISSLVDKDLSHSFYTVGLKKYIFIEKKNFILDIDKNELVRILFLIDVTDEYHQELSILTIELVFGLFLLTAMLGVTYAGLKYLHAQHQRSSEKFYTILNTQKHMIIITDGNDVFDINRQFLDFLGYLNKGHFQRYHADIANLFLAKDGHFTNDKIDRYDNWVDAFSHLPETERMVTMCNAKHDEKSFSVAVSHFNEKKYLLAFADITDLEKERQKFKLDSLTDSLTQLANRKKYTEIVNAEIARSARSNTPFCIIIFDINRFKNINDTYGHNIGDAVLKKASALAKTCVRTSDMVARWGGDEFVVFLPETNLTDAIIVAEKLSEIFENIREKKLPKFTASFGVAMWKDEDNIKDIIKRADTNLYKAKKNGHDKVVAL